MFDNLKKPPEDIFAETEKPNDLVPPPFRTTPPPTNSQASPNVPPLTPFVPPPAIPSASSPLSVRPPKVSSENKGKNIVLIIIVAILVIVAGVLLSSWILGSKTKENSGLPNVSNAVEETLDQNKTNVGQENTMTGNSAVNNQVPTKKDEIKPVEVDSDKDGLTDAEEITFGTKPTNPDTDSDGLFDYEEIKTYKTNPLVPDTDSDGYLDGAEVKSGYNPNGAGKLLVLPEKD